MVNGETRKEPAKYVGLTEVKVRAINPTRAELNDLFGKEASDKDKENVYLTTDKNGDTRLTLAIWMENEDGLFFNNKISITAKDALSTDKEKTMFINQTLDTSYADEEDNLPTWFTNFTVDDESVGSKSVRKALMGEEELAIFLKAWLAKLNFKKPSASVVIDTEKLFNEDYSELKSLIDSKFVAPIVILAGVETDENDSTKQYQKVWSKGFLPTGFMSFIKNNFKGNEWNTKVWKRFEDKVTGSWGFKAYFDLVPLKVYDPNVDVAQQEETKKEVTPVNSKY